VGVDLLDVQVDREAHTGGIQIGFLLTERAFVTVEILSQDGRRVAVVAANQQESIGRHRYLWDGRHQAGGRPGPGCYTVRISAEPTYSSYHYFQKVIERKVRL
jgi:flagellar hook assembly protein FlgD